MALRSDAGRGTGKSWLGHLGHPHVDGVQKRVAVMGRIEPNLVCSQGAGHVDVAVRQITPKFWVVVRRGPWKCELVFVKHDHALDAMPAGWQEAFQLGEVAHVCGEEDVGWSHVLQFVCPERRRALHPPLPMVGGKRFEFHEMSLLGKPVLDASAPSCMGSTMKGVQQENVRGIVHGAKF